MSHAGLSDILTNAGIRVALLTTEVPPESREGWYERQLRAGVQAVICHPKLVQTGLDLIDFPTILFYETGYSIYVLRQASRRSWRIGQRASGQSQVPALRGDDARKLSATDGQEAAGFVWLWKASSLPKGCKPSMTVTTS